ncbi:MAG: LacI family DNA-binding transcriptional regulator [Verrucomicrobia bacterium]|nr:LacI family DNA-binding transcriptional regulator [Verrucomicrobiota bacterium]
MKFCTQTDIARTVGVSQRAVGAVLGNGRSNSQVRVGPQLRRRILAVAHRRNYRPHRYAQVMRTGRSGVIGMIQFGGMTQFAAQRAFHVAQVVHAEGCQLLANDAIWHPEGVGAACSAMLDARAEGILLVSPSEWFPLSELARIQKAKIPVVSMSGVRLPDVVHLRADVRQGMRDLTRHLLRLGYRRLTMLTTWPSRIRDRTHCWPIMERVAGFRQAVAESKTSSGQGQPVEMEVVYGDFTDEWSDPYRIGELAMKNMLQKFRRPEVALCSNDDWAVGALAACADAGLRVPQDMAITGFDNAVFSNYGAVRLTTVAQPVEQMTRQAVTLLMRMVRGDKLSSSEQLLKLPCQLVVRQSCGANGRK